MSHTKEPWKINPREDEDFGFEIVNSSGECVADDGSAWGEYNASMDLDTARRIVACVNACAGIPDSELVYGKPAFGNMAVVHSSFADRYEYLAKLRDDLQLEVEELQRKLDERGGVSELRRMRVEELEKQRDDLLAALEQIAAVSGGLPSDIATKAIASVKACGAQPEKAENGGAVWSRITAPGQVKVGDKLRFTIGPDKFNGTAKLILHAGTDREEIIYNKRRNHYLITSMAIANNGSQKNAEFFSERRKGGAA